MTENKKVCSSCKKEIANDAGSAVFKCPKCSKGEVVRCKHCREIAVKYVCTECGFEGPN